jgi:hypothetical protein
MEGFRACGWQTIRTGLPNGRSLLVIAVALAAVVLSARDARAVPSFARQTGLACSACHTVFLELNSFGRAFKLHGYTTQAMKEQLEEAGTEQAPPLNINRTFPLSVMLQTSITRTNAKQPDTQNANVEFPQQLSLFLAGEITPHIGTFVQATYTGQDDHFSLDNTDIRYADQTQIGGKELVYGLTLNNNPTIEDLWHSTPAWAWPFANADSAPTPAAAALLDGTLGQQVAGLGAYSLWNKHLYGAVTMYRSAHIGSPQPPSSTDNDTIRDVAPYWRLAWQQNFGLNYLEVGTYGMFAQLFPTGVSGSTNKYTDLAFDAQFERPLGKDSLSAHATYIYENQQLDASLASGDAANHNDKLNTFRLDGIYHWRSTLSLALGYFLTTGSSDTILYQPEAIAGSANGSPDSNGLTAEVSYFPWQNVRLSALYTSYFEFNGSTNNYDGSGRSSFDNNTLYVLLWLMY